MFDVKDLVAELCKQERKHFSFEPTDVQLSDLTAPTIKAYEEPQRLILPGSNVSNIFDEFRHVGVSALPKDHPSALTVAQQILSADEWAAQKS
jgi:hypothetical protein